MPPCSVVQSRIVAQRAIAVARGLVLDVVCHPVGYARLYEGTCNNVRIKKDILARLGNK